MTNYTQLFPVSKFIGFDSLLNDLNRLTKEADNYYPPFNIIKDNESDYTIELALAGFAKEDLSIEIDKNTLIVSGSVKQTETTQYLHKGISTKKFKRTFKLADYVEVGGADFKDGILVIKLYYVVPENLRPRVVTIN